MASRNVIKPSRLASSMSMAGETSWAPCGPSGAQHKKPKAYGRGHTPIAAAETVRWYSASSC